MEFRNLGRTGIPVSVIALGGWQLTAKGGRNWPGMEKQHCISLVHAAMDARINLLDTAIGYGGGESETILGEALRGRRERTIIATKLGPEQLPNHGVAAACDLSLKRLATDYIDLYQVHWPNRDVPPAEIVEQMNQLKAAGKIRAFGVSNYGPLDMADLTAVGRFESNQLAYNLLFRSIEFGEQAKCADNDIGILCYSPLCQGLLSGKFKSPDDVPPGRARMRHFGTARKFVRHGGGGFETETFAAIDAIREISRKINQPMSAVSLAWCLHQRGVTSVIAGARDVDQIRENVKAAELKLSAATIAELNRVTDALKAALGHFSDPWGSPDEGRWR